MKRILIVFGLLVCFALPAQIASAYSYNSGLSFGENMNQLAREGGGKAYLFPTSFASSDYFDIVQIYSSADGLNALDRASNVEGFVLGRSVKPEDLFIQDKDMNLYSMMDYVQSAVMIHGVKDLEYEADGNCIPMYSATIMLYVVLPDSTELVFAVTPTGVYSPTAPAVPVPGAALLLGTGVVGLMSLRRKQG